MALNKYRPVGHKSIILLPLNLPLDVSYNAGSAVAINIKVVDIVSSIQTILLYCGNFNLVTWFVCIATHL